MNENRSERDIAIETNARLKGLTDELLGGGGRTGRLDKIDATLEKQDEAAQAHGLMDDMRFNKIDGQLNYWKGGLAAVIAIGAGLITLAIAFFEHVYGGK